MNFTFVSHFKAKPFLPSTLKQRLQVWDNERIRLSGVSITDAARKLLESDGNIGWSELDGITDGGEQVLASAFEGYLLLPDNSIVKSCMIYRVNETEFNGEIYVTFMNFPQSRPIEKKYFSLLNILCDSIFTEHTPFKWSPTTPTKLVVELGLFRPMQKIILSKQAVSRINVMHEHILEQALAIYEKKKAEGIVEQPQELDLKETTEEESIQEPTETKTAESVETTKDSISEIQSVTEQNNLDIEQETDITKLREMLVEYKSENEALSERNEQLSSENRLFKKNRNAFVQNIEDQKKRLKILKKRAENAEAHAKEAASGDVKEFCDYFDKERERLESEIDNKDKLIEKLKAELGATQGQMTILRSKLNKQNPGGTDYSLLIAPKDENEKYENEFSIALFSALHKAIDKTAIKSNSPRTRCIDVWQAIIDANPDIEKIYENFCDDQDTLKKAILGGNLERSKQLLKPFGLTFDRHANCHGKITFGDDPRYIGTTSSTTSDTVRGFINCAGDLRSTFLYPT